MFLFLLLVISFSQNSSNKSEPIKPGQEYMNQGGQDVYLILRLQPGEKFTNNSDYTFKILPQKSDRYYMVLEDSLLSYREKVHDQLKNEIETLEKQGQHLRDSLSTVE
jgi:hypothetical protein